MIFSKVVNHYYRRIKMIGYLVTGHGEFSKGLMSSLNMIAGEQDGVTAINFEENANLEKYQETLKEKVVPSP